MGGRHDLVHLMCGWMGSITLPICWVDGWAALPCVAAVWARLLLHAPPCRFLHPPLLSLRPPLISLCASSRNFKAAPSYVKSFLRKGQAQLGMGLSREAAATFDQGAGGRAVACWHLVAWLPKRVPALRPAGALACCWAGARRHSCGAGVAA